MLFERPGTVASLGGSWLSSATRAEGSTLLEAVDGSNAEPTSAAAAGRFPGRPRGVRERWVGRPDGSAARTAGIPPCRCLARGRTIVVADPTGSTETRTYDLRGNFEPEAFSTDDRHLFLIQHLPAEAPTVYRVSRCSTFARGRVRPVFGPFKGPAERMPGIRLQQVLSPNADQLYTLYSSAQPGYAPHEAPVANRRDGVVRARAEPPGRDGRTASGCRSSCGTVRRPSRRSRTSPNGRLLYIVDATLGARDRHGHARRWRSCGLPRSTSPWTGVRQHLGRRERRRRVAVRRDRRRRRRDRRGSTRTRSTWFADAWDHG